MRALVCLCLAAHALAGCAIAVDTRVVGSGPAPTTYELRGRTLAALDAQARRLCQQGHVVLHRWELVHPQPEGITRAERWLHTANGWVGSRVTDTVEADRAQMTVQCSA